MKGDLVAHILLNLTDDKNWCDKYDAWRDEVIMENGERHFIDANPQKDGGMFINIRQVKSKSSTTFKDGKLMWLSPSLVHAKCYASVNKMFIRSEIRAKAKNYKSENGKDFTQWQPYLQQYCF